jgi:hypothetical protein
MPAGPIRLAGWRVVEIWESGQDGQNWFDHNIKPNLPGVVPAQTYYRFAPQSPSRRSSRARQLRRLA